MKHIAIGILSTAGVALALSGCGGQQESANTASDGATTSSSSQSSVKLTGAGATFPYPIYSKWFDQYKQKTGVEINYQSVGSGAGIKQLMAGTVVFGASDAPLSDKDAGAMPSPVSHIPTVAGAVALTYNLPGATGTLKLDGPTLAGIFLGEITKWNDPKIAALNAGMTLPATAITVAHRSDGSGTSYIFTNYLAAVSPKWKAKPGAGKSVEWPVGLGGKGSDGVSSVVKGSPGSIGYVELAYAKQNKMPVASMKNKAGQFVAPNVEGTTAAAEGSLVAVQKDVRAPIVNAEGAKSYPIAGFTYILVYKQSQDAAKGKAMIDFLKWAITDGQKEAAALDYAPLPAAVVEINNKTIAELK